MSHMMLEINSCLWKTECTKYEGSGERDFDSVIIDCSLDLDRHVQNFGKN